jgi:hypothetical protein
MEAHPEADTVTNYLTLEGSSDWRTTVYQDDCSTVMTHDSFIDLAKELDVDIF